MTGIPKYLRIALGVIVIAALIIVPMNFNRYGLFILSQWAVMTIAAMGLNLTLGYAGQISLAQGAFVGIGAYAAAIMTTQGMPLVAALAVAIVLCFAIGLAGIAAFPDAGTGNELSPAPAALLVHRLF